MEHVMMHPIGIIRSPFTEKDQTPIQASRSEAFGRLELEPAFTDGLRDLEGFSHIIILYVFDRMQGYKLQVKPFLDDKERGLFATRFPARPNPIGLSVVKLVTVHDHVLEVEGIDVLDGSPLLDIKPYIPEFDVRMDVRTGWYGQRSTP